MESTPHLDTYNSIKFCLKLMILAIILIATGYSLANFNKENLTNSWKAIPVIIGFILCAPILIYGTFTSVIFWRDHMDKKKGEWWLALMIIVSTIQISNQSVSFLFWTYFFLKYTLPGYRKLSKINP